MTNADLIRRCSDEQLARLLSTMLLERDKFVLGKLGRFGILTRLTQVPEVSYEIVLEFMKREEQP